MSVASLVAKWEGYTSPGIRVITPMRNSSGKVITCVGPLLIINLGISHLFLNWLPSPGAQEWLRTIGGARCSTTNQMTLGKAFFRGERGHRSWLVLQFSPRKQGGQFSFKEESVTLRHWDVWVWGVPVLYLCCALFPSKHLSPLKMTIMLFCLLSVYSEEHKLQEGGDFTCMVERLGVGTLELDCLIRTYALPLTCYGTCTSHLNSPCLSLLIFKMGKMSRHNNNTA